MKYEGLSPEEILLHQQIENALKKGVLHFSLKGDLLETPREIIEINEFFSYSDDYGDNMGMHNLKAQIVTLIPLTQERRVMIDDSKKRAV